MKHRAIGRAWFSPMALVLWVTGLAAIPGCRTVGTIWERDDEAFRVHMAQLMATIFVEQGEDWDSAIRLAEEAVVKIVPVTPGSRPISVPSPRGPTYFCGVRLDNGRCVLWISMMRPGSMLDRSRDRDLLKTFGPYPIPQCLCNR